MKRAMQIWINATGILAVHDYAPCAVSRCGAEVSCGELVHGQFNFGGDGGKEASPEVIDRFYILHVQVIHKYTFCFCGDTVVEPYNAVSSFHQLVENADECMLRDNVDGGQVLRNENVLKLLKHFERQAHVK